MARLLPMVAVWTAIVSIPPLCLVWNLRASGVVMSMPLLVAIGILASLALAAVGRFYWESRPRRSDLTFSELMIWGFLRRWKVERRLSNARELLGLSRRAPVGDAKDLTAQKKVKLLEQLAGALESRDPYTHGHSRRVARHAALIAKTMAVPRAERVKIRAAAAVHDIGKIDTPREILNKPGRLTDEEFGVIKLHPGRGAEMMLERGLDPELAEIVAHHHERIDGTGYPDGLASEEIPLGSRIIAVADTFDALVSNRPYRAPYTHRRAIAVLQQESGKQLDDDAVRAFCRNYSGFRPLAAWALITNLPARLLYPVIGELQAGAASAAKVVATSAAAAGVASAVVATDAAVQASAPAPPVVHEAAERAAGIAHALEPESQTGHGGSTKHTPDGAGSPSHGPTSEQGPSSSGNPASSGSTGSSGSPTGSGDSSGGSEGSSGGAPNSGDGGGVSGSGSSGGSGNSGSGSGSSGSGSSGSGSSGSGSGSSGSGSGGSGSSSSGSSGSSSGSGSSGSGSSGSGSKGHG
ncbi:MAG TPA: HD-GYP domain-containing protein [Solirubrobacterales bacterium]|nr:HD-GYP domain-containing protein [Solirubrobacterales bacterium]